MPFQMLNLSDCDSDSDVEFKEVATDERIEVKGVRARVAAITKAIQPVKEPPVKQPESKYFNTAVAAEGIINDANKLFKTLNDDLKDFKINGYAEYQRGITGVMLDFDYKQITDKPEITLGQQKNLLKAIFRIVNSNFRATKYDDVIGPPDLRGYILQRPLVGDKLKQRGDLFTHGFHVLLPEVMLDKDRKMFLIEQICKNVDFKEIFADCGLQSYNMIDYASAWVPVFMYGSSAPNKYKYHKLICGATFDTETQAFDVMSKKALTNTTVADLSINEYEIKSDMEKQEYIVADHAAYDAFHAEIERRKQQKQKDADKYEPKPDEIEYALSKKNTLIEMIGMGVMALDETYSNDGKKWRGILALIKNLSRTYKIDFTSLAIEFSRRSAKFVSDDDVIRNMEISKPFGQLGLLRYFLRDSTKLEEFDRNMTEVLPIKRDWSYFRNRGMQTTTADEFTELKRELIDFMNSSCCIIESNKTFYLVEEQMHDKASGNIKNTVFMKGIKCLQQDFSNKNITTMLNKDDWDNDAMGRKCNHIDVFNSWMTSPIRRSFRKIDLDPFGYFRHIENETVEKRIYNLYKGPGISRESLCNIDTKDFEETEEFFNHIKRRWCVGNMELYNAILDRFAHLIQFPWIKMESALILMGVERCGKGFILQIVAEILGKDYFYQPSNSDEVFGSFNSGMSTCLMLFLDELAWGGDKQKAGIIKKLITEPHIYINKKFLPVEKLDNIMNVFAASNEAWVVPAGKTEQRFQAVGVSSELAEMSSAESKPIIDAIRGIDMKRLAKFFYERDVSKFNHRKIIATEALRMQKIQSMCKMEKWWLGILEEGRINGIEVFSSCISKKVVFKDYIEFSGDQHMIDKLFWKQLKPLAEVEFSRKSINGERVYTAQFGTLEENQNKWKLVFADPDWDF